MEKVKKFMEENAEIFRQIFIQHKAIMFLIEPETGKIMFANRAASEFYGYSVEKLCTMSISEINTLPPDVVKTERMKDISEERGYFIFPHKLAGGEIKTVEVYSSPVVIKGKTLLYSIIHDISERKKMERRINALLREKDIILKEAHHSIKNNMNAIQSILAIQSESIKDKSAVNALKVSAGRIKSMMVLYDKLHFMHNTSELRIREYFSDLIDEIISLFPDRGLVTVEKDIEDFTIKQHTLFILGLIVNELLTNIMKYAFPGDAEGRIKFKASLRNRCINIEVRDNGKGLPEPFDMKDSTGFGMQLVEMLCEQINCNIKIERGNGAGFILEFRQDD